MCKGTGVDLMPQMKYDIPDELHERFKNAVKTMNQGESQQIWGKLSKEICKAMEFYLEEGPLQYYDTTNECNEENNRLLQELTSDDYTSKQDPNILFLKEFDNHKLIYPRMRLEKDVIKTVIKEITGKNTLYSWRKYSKLLRETGRIKNVPGTNYYDINLKEFVYCERKSENVMDDVAKWVYERFTKGEIINPGVVDSMVHCGEKTSRNILSLMEEEGKVEFVSYRVGNRVI